MYSVTINTEPGSWTRNYRDVRYVEVSSLTEAETLAAWAREDGYTAEVDELVQLSAER
jgi:hypothetical protein